MKALHPFAVASLLLAGAALPAPRLFAAEATAGADDAEVCPVPPVIVPRPADPAAEPAWVSRRVAELQPNPAERKIDRVGWAASVLEAERLGRELNRPVFLFTLDGRMNTGRC